MFGLKNGFDCRCFYVARRDRVTLEHIIRREVQEGSVVHSDEWPAYSNLNRYFNHSTVNHQQNYVNPRDGTHTQNIERSWLEAKIRILKKMRGVPMETFQSHLDFICWKIIQSNEGNLFVSFLNGIRTVYRS